MNRPRFLLAVTFLVTLLLVSSLITVNRACAASIQPEKRGKVVILHLSGRFTIGEGDLQFRHAVYDHFDQGFFNIVVDLGNVTRVDASMIGELVSGYTSATHRDGKLVLCNLPAKIHEILQITKLITVFETFDSIDAAVASFKH